MVLWAAQCCSSQPVLCCASPRTCRLERLSFSLSAADRLTRVWFSDRVSKACSHRQPTSRAVATTRLEQAWQATWVALLPKCSSLMQKLQWGSPRGAQEVL